MCIRVTQWLAHKCACETFHIGFENFLDALATSYAKRKEAKALGLLILSNHCNKFDAPWCFPIYKTSNFIFFKWVKVCAASAMQTLTMSYVFNIWMSSKINQTIATQKTLIAWSKVLMTEPWPCHLLLEFALKNLTLNILPIMYSQNLLMHL